MSESVDKPAQIESHIASRRNYKAVVILDVSTRRERARCSHDCRRSCVERSECNVARLIVVIASSSLR